MAMENFADASGIPLHWTDAPGGTGDMCAALASGQADLAVLLTEGIVKHIAGGGEARIVGTYTETPLVWGIHVPANHATIHTEADLRGARYAISRFGSGSHLMAALDAVQRGWEVPSFEVVGTLEAARTALGSGQADAFMWEKTMTLPFVHSGEWKRVGEFAGPWPAFVIAASASFLSTKPTWLPALLAQVAQACDRAESQREDTVRFIGDRYNIPADDILKWLDETRWQCTPNVRRDVLNTVVDTLYDAEIIDQRLAAESLVDTPDRLV